MNKETTRTEKIDFWRSRRGAEVFLLRDSPEGKLFDDDLLRRFTTYSKAQYWMSLPLNTWRHHCQLTSADDWSKANRADLGHKQNLTMVPSSLVGRASTWISTVNTLRALMVLAEDNDLPLIHCASTKSNSWNRRKSFRRFDHNLAGCDKWAKE